MPITPQDVQRIATRLQLRSFLQLGGARYGNRMRFMGVDNGFVEITGVSNPRQGDPEPIQVVDPYSTTGFRVAGKTRSPAGFPKATMKIYENTTGIPLTEIMGGCDFTYYDTLNSCGDDISDHLKGWRNGYVRIYANCTIGNADLGDRTTKMADGELSQSLSLTVERNYVSGSVYIKEPSISILADAFAKDVIYAPRYICESCGNASDGTRIRYACTAAPTTSPGAKPYVLYTLDYGVTWTAVQVTSAAVAEDLVAIRAFGSYLVVVSKTGGGSSTSALHYASINTKTGVPGTWTKVTTGFVGGAGVNDMIVLSPSLMLLVGDSGYVYKCENIASGVTVVASGLGSSATLNRIKGNYQQLVIGGNAGVVLRSIDRGNSWTSLSSPTVSSVAAVEAIGDQTIWLGSAATLYVSYDGGTSWSTVPFDGSGSGTLWDIRAATPEKIWFTHTASGNIARLFGSYNGGQSFDNSAPMVEGFGTYYRIERIATPEVGATWTVLANDVSLAGRASVSAGQIVIGGGNYV